MSLFPVTPRNLWEKASLVIGGGWMIKASAIQAIKPLLAAGMLGFERGTNGSYFDKNGQMQFAAVNTPRVDWLDPVTGSITNKPSISISRLATNLSLRSQEFDDAYWTKTAGGINTAIGTNGIQPNVAVAPDGTMTADRINFINQSNATLGMSRLYTEPTGSSTYTKSIFVKGEGSEIGKAIRMNLRRVTGGYIESNLTIILTAEWKRIELPLTLGAGNTQMNVYYYSDIGGATSALIWGAHFNIGAKADEYVPTTTASASRNAEVVPLTGCSALLGQTEGALYAEVLLTTGSQNPTIGSGIITAKASLSTRNNTVDIIRDTANNSVRFILISGGIVIFNVNFAVVAGVNKLLFNYKSGVCSFFVNGVKVGTNATPFAFTETLNAFRLGKYQETAGDEMNGRIRCAAVFPSIVPDDSAVALTTL